MAFPTLSVKDGNNVSQTINTTPNAGQATMANSLGVVIASDQSAVPVSGTFWQATQPVSIATMPTTPVTGTFWQATQPVSGTVTSNISGSISNTSFLNGSFAAQAATTSGLTGALIQGAVTTTAPAYTTATTNPLSLTTGGSLRGDVSSYAGTALTGTVTAYGTAPTGNVFGVNAAVTSGTLTTVTTVGTVTTVAAMTKGNLGLPVLVADVASAALTTTTTSSTFTPGFGCSYEVNIPVTVVSGTTPTLDVVVQESDDGGTNWFDVYHFPRITATGFFRSPKIPLTGTVVRYVQTVAGTTPSFTRAVNRLQSSDTAQPLRKIYDRTLAATQTLNATTATLNVLSAARNLQLVISSGTITTTAPSIQLQGSDDGGASWYFIGTTLLAVASSTVQTTVNNVYSEQVRAIVTVAGSAATLNYVAIKAF